MSRVARGRSGLECHCALEAQTQRVRRIARTRPTQPAQPSCVKRLALTHGGRPRANADRAVHKVRVPSAWFNQPSMPCYLCRQFKGATWDPSEQRVLFATEPPRAVS